MDGSFLNGIYAVESDKLTLCIASAGSSWPTAFSATAGSERTLISFQRFPPGEHEVEEILRRAKIRVSKNQEGWIVRIVRPPNLDDALAAEISKLKKLDTLSITGDLLTEAGLRSIAKLENLQRLFMHRSPVCDAGIAEIAKMKSLQRLTILAPNLTDEACKHLSNLKTLTSLDLYGAEGLTDRYGRVLDTPATPLPNVSDTGIGEIALLSNLESLTLFGIPLTDEGLSYFAEHTNLKSLRLLKTEITDAGLTHIAQLTGLTNLTLGYSAITDAGFAKLSKLNGLLSLDIAGTALTDESLMTIVNSFTDLWQIRATRVTGLTDDGLLELSKLKKLKSLAVSQGQFKEETLANLRAASSDKIVIQELL